MRAMPDPHLLSNIKKILEYCVRAGLQWKRDLSRPGNDWRDKLIEGPDKVLPGISLKFLMDDSEVAGMPINGRCDANSRRIFLKPPDGYGNVLPVLAFTWDRLNSDQPALSLRLGLFVKDKDKEAKPKFIGMRFETPECNAHGEKADGKHDYYHAQPINGFDKNDGLSESHSVKWLPVSFPAAPLAASDPLSLFATMLISLYGGKIVGELVGQLSGNGRSSLEQLLNL